MRELMSLGRPQGRQFSRSEGARHAMIEHAVRVMRQMADAGRRAFQRVIGRRAAAMPWRHGSRDAPPPPP